MLVSFRFRLSCLRLAWGCGSSTLWMVCRQSMTDPSAIIQPSGLFLELDQTFAFTRFGRRAPFRLRLRGLVGRPALDSPHLAASAGSQ